MNNRQSYRNSKKKFKKISVEIELDLYEKLLKIKNDYFDNRTTKYIINEALKDYLE